MAREWQGKVLVVGDNDLAGLTVVRSLGRAGLEVHLVAFEPDSIARASRYVQRVYHLGHPLQEPAAFTERFLALIRRVSFDLAVPTSDKALVPLMAYREEIERHTRFAGPDPVGFAATNDKAETVRLAWRLGIPVPRTLLLSAEAEQPEELTAAAAALTSAAAAAAAADGRWPRPLVLKPSCSVLHGRTRRNEVQMVHSEEELRDGLAVLLPRCPVLVQEFCPGFGVGLSVLADRGELVAAFQHERVHEPPQGGVSSYRRSVPLSPPLLEAARRFCAELRWTGPAMLEFKVDPHGGEAVLMEVNGRLWGSLALAVHAGVDFPRLLYELLVRGRARPTFTYRVPCYVRHTTRDLYWLWSNVRAPRGQANLLRKSATEVLGELGNLCRGWERYDLESLTDPLPALLGWVRLLRDLGRGVARRLGHWRDRRLAQRQAARVQRPDAPSRDPLHRVRSVLFVCQGNINRSAVAAQLLREQCRSRGWDLRVASAGLLPHAGRPSGPVSREVAAALGVDLSEHRSTALTAGWLQEFDLVVVMEAAHLAGIRALSRSALQKTFLLSSFGIPDDGMQSPRCGHAADIPDPEAKSRAVFQAVYEAVRQSVAGLVRQLEQGGRTPSVRRGAGGEAVHRDGPPHRRAEAGRAERLALCDAVTLRHSPFETCGSEAR